jgi:hypothetical protein
MYTAKSLKIRWNPALGNHDIVANSSVSVSICRVNYAAVKFVETEIFEFCPVSWS